VSTKTRRKKRRALAGSAAQHADLGNGNVLVGPSFPAAAIVEGAHDVEPLAKILAEHAKQQVLGNLANASNEAKLLEELWNEAKGGLEKSSGPPRLGTFLFLLIPIRQREHLLGDLEEEFRTTLVPRYGPRWARFYFYWHVVVELTTALTKGVTGAVLGFAISRFTK